MNRCLTISARWRRRSRSSGPIRDVVAIAERPDGSRVAFRPYPTPLFDPPGNFTGAVNMLIDVTDEQSDALSTSRPSVAAGSPMRRMIAAPARSSATWPKASTGPRRAGAEAAASGRMHRLEPGQRRIQIALVPDAISNSTALRVLSGAHEVGQALLSGAQPELRRQVPLQQFEVGRDLIARRDAGLPANRRSSPAGSSRRSSAGTATSAT